MEKVKVDSMEQQKAEAYADEFTWRQLQYVQKLERLVHLLRDMVKVPEHIVNYMEYNGQWYYTNERYNRSAFLYPIDREIPQYMLTTVLNSRDEEHDCSLQRYTSITLTPHVIPVVAKALEQLMSTDEFAEMYQRQEEQEQQNAQPDACSDETSRPQEETPACNYDAMDGAKTGAEIDQ